MNSPSLSFGISSADFEVFSQRSCVAAVKQRNLSSLRLLLSSRDFFCGNHHLHVFVAAVQPNRQRLAPLGFLPLQHLPVPRVHLTRVCLALFVALSGFVYPLSGFLLHGPGLPFFRHQRSWGSPLQSFVPAAEHSPFRGSLLSCPFLLWIRPDTTAVGLQSLALNTELASRSLFLHKARSRYSLGVFIFEA